MIRGKGTYFQSIPKHCVSVILPASNEAVRITDNITRLRKWQAVKEVIVVANGCTDHTASLARNAGATVLEYKESLGHDVGRAIGAKAASGRYLLFVDADISWGIAELRPFIWALRRGVDVALNQYPRPAQKQYFHRTAVAKRALNWILNRPDLRASSLTAVPHAIRRSTAKRIGLATLATPPVALAKAVLQGFSVETAGFVNVSARSRARSRNATEYSTMELILGDHVEAIAHVITERGRRGGQDDDGRNRAVLDIFEPTARFQSSRAVAAVIPARNEARTLSRVVAETGKLRGISVLVVENGSTDDSRKLAAAAGAKVEGFEDAIGHDVGRAIGAMYAAKARSALFLDSDFTVPAADLQKFVEATEHGRVDVALNDVAKGLKPWQMVDAVSTVKRFLNIAVGRHDLGIASLTAVPHGLSHRALGVIPAADFMVPPVAHTRAILAGLTVEPVHYVDVIRRNRYRPSLHARRLGGKLQKLIIGDHVEAFDLLVSTRGTRGGFCQPRRIDVAQEFIATYSRKRSDS